MHSSVALHRRTIYVRVRIKGVTNGDFEEEQGRPTGGSLDCVKIIR